MVFPPTRVEWYPHPLLDLPSLSIYSLLRPIPFSTHFHLWKRRDLRGRGFEGSSPRRGLKGVLTHSACPNPPSQLDSLVDSSSF